MPQIIPIKDLKNTSQIAALCDQSDEPIFVTKNGYGQLVIMSVDVYQKTLIQQEVRAKLSEAERNFSSGAVREARSVLNELRQKHEL